MYARVTAHYVYEYHIIDAALLQHNLLNEAYEHKGFTSESEFDEEILARHASVRNCTENDEFKIQKRKVEQQTVEKRTALQVFVYKWLVYACLYTGTR